MFLSWALLGLLGDLTVAFPVIKPQSKCDRVCRWWPVASLPSSASLPNISSFYLLEPIHSCQEVHMDTIFPGFLWQIHLAFIRTYQNQPSYEMKCRALTTVLSPQSTIRAALASFSSSDSSLPNICLLRYWSCPLVILGHCVLPIEGGEELMLWNQMLFWEWNGIIELMEVWACSQETWFEVWLLLPSYFVTSGILLNHPNHSFLNSM